MVISNTTIFVASQKGRIEFSVMIRQEMSLLFEWGLVVGPTKVEIIGEVKLSQMSAGSIS